MSYRSASPRYGEGEGPDPAPGVFRACRSFGWLFFALRGRRGGQDSGSCLREVRLGRMASDIMGEIVK